MYKSGKIILVSCLFILLSQISYANLGGFEVIVNVPIGAGVTLLENKSSIAGSPKENASFQVGIETDIGYMFYIKENMGFSLLGSIGYNFTGFSYSKNNKTETYNMPVHDIYIGFYPKFNIEGFSIGINSGVKFGLSPVLHYKSPTVSKDITIGIKPRTYIKGTFDYSIFFKDNMAVNVGLYIGYDWGWNFADTYSELNTGKNETFGNLDVGVQIGYRFGPKF